MKLDKSVQITIIIVIGVIVLALIGYSILFSLNPSDTINVNGEATIEVIPNLVGIYFNVETSGETSEEATSENAEIVEELQNSLISKGFNNEDLKTQSFNVYPDYDWVNGNRVEKGYKATHSMKVELSTKEKSKIGEVIDAGVGAGAGISYINFELSEDLQTEYKAQAIEKAAQDAKLKAEALAKGAGKSVGKLVSISDSSFNYYPMLAYESATASVDVEEVKAATQIEPGEQEISARVSAVFKIK